MPVQQFNKRFVPTDEIEEVELRIGGECVCAEMRRTHPVESGEEPRYHILWDGILNGEEAFLFKLLFFRIRQTVL